MDHHWLVFFFHGYSVLLHFLMIVLQQANDKYDIEHYLLKLTGNLH